MIAIDVAEYDPYSEAVLDDPYPFYRALRAESPVHYLEKWNSWALSRFDDIWDASMDNEHYTAEQGSSPQYLLTKTIPALPNLNHMDPPSQTKLRAAVAPRRRGPRAAARRCRRRGHSRGPRRSSRTRSRGASR